MLYRGTIISRRGKCFSIVEIMIASLFSLALGAMVATTLNSATSTLRSNNAKINSISSARSISSNLEKYISSATKATFCQQVSASGTNCDLILTYDDMNSFIRSCVGSNCLNGNSNDIQIEFLSDRCISNSGICNNTFYRYAIRYQAEKSNFNLKKAEYNNNYIIVCRNLTPVDTSNKSSIKTEVEKNSNMPCYRGASGSVDPSLKIEYFAQGLLSFSNKSVFKIIKGDGRIVDLDVGVSNTLNDISNLANRLSLNPVGIRVALILPWGSENATGSRNGFQGNYINSDITSRGNWKNEIK